MTGSMPVAVGSRTNRCINHPFTNHPCIVGFDYRCDRSGGDFSVAKHDAKY